jgi:hypothetical protein
MLPRRKRPEPRRPHLTADSFGQGAGPILAGSKETAMFFAIPIVGKILAGFAASEASADVSSTQTSPQNIQAIAGHAANPTDFAQTLDAIDQAASARLSHESLSAGKV